MTTSTLSKANEIPHPSITELLSFLLWIDYIKAGQAKEMPTWKAVNKREIAHMLIERMQAVLTNLEEAMDRATPDKAISFGVDIASLMASCTQLLKECRCAA